jgi:putative ABC transport system ATP-binding protein
MLSVEGVWKAYSRGDQWTAVLADVSFEVVPGEIVAIIGGRLTGKTTLLRIAAGMERPDRGAVSLAGRSLVGLGDRCRSRMLGEEIVWVDRECPGRTVEVVRFVGWPLAGQVRSRREVERRATQALERVGAPECVGRRWCDLSNRQRVLVGLARAFVGKPKLVVIDDLLDALGSRGTEEVSDLLRSLLEGSEPRCAVLMSASDMESAMFADRVWSLSRKGALKGISGQLRGDGEIIEFPGEANTDGA